METILDAAGQAPGAAATTAWMRGWATSADEAIEYGLNGA